MKKCVLILGIFMPFSTDSPQTKSKLNMHKELKIPFDKASAQLLYTVSSALFLGFSSIVIILTMIQLLPTISLSLFYLLLVLEIFFASLAMLYAWMFYGACRVIKYSSIGPAMILNAKGIKMGNFGLIPWNSIESIGIRCTFSTAKFIELIIKNDSLPLIRKQCSFQGKRIIFWAKLFQKPCSLFIVFPLFNEEIISFSQHYLPNNAVKKFVDETESPSQVADTVCENKTKEYLCIRCHAFFEYEGIDHIQAEYYVCPTCMHMQNLKHWGGGGGT
jgi:DNA-directed RNA polymerase subunit RPC12/RpoP